MMKKIGDLWPYLALIALIGGLFILGILGDGARSRISGVSNGGNTANVLSVAENDFDFGEISMAAGKVRHTFKIKNTGSTDAIVAKIYTSCMCTEARMMIDGNTFGPFGMPGHGGFIPTIGKTLVSGGEAEVVVEFDPAAHGPAGIGIIKRVVYVETGSTKPLEIKFGAVVKP